MLLLTNMTNKLPATVLLLGPLLLAPGARAQKVSADGAMQTFNYLSDQFFSQVYFKFSPTGGTAAGLHQYDAQLEDYSAAGVEREIAALRGFEKKVAAIDASALDAPAAADREILLNNIRSELLSLEVVRGWEKNPDSYSSGITSSAFVILERPYAPTDTRLRALVEREKKMPQALAEARKNLKAPARISTEIALEQIDGDVSFFENDVPSAFLSGPDAATDAATKAEFARTNAAVVAALKSYGAWMKTDLLPRSNGDFRLGAETFQKKLAYDEMVDIPLARLLAIAIDDLHRNQAEFARVAKQVDPAKTPQEVLAELATIHPGAGPAAERVPWDIRLADRLYPRAPHHYDSQRRAADAGGDAAVHARDDLCVDGPAGAVRDALHEGVLQRDAAGEGLDAGARRRAHGELQRGDDRFDQRA